MGLQGKVALVTAGGRGIGRRAPSGSGGSHRLYLIMSNFTWTLWFSVHHGLVEPNSDVQFDYWEEALDKWSQAVRDLESPELGRLLERARLPD